MIIKGKKEKSLYRKSSIKPPGGLFFSSTFWGGQRGGWGGLKEKMVTILSRLLERKVKHMRLEVKGRKTENNMNFQPEETITDQSTLIVCDESRGGAGWGGGGGP